MWLWVCQSCGTDWASWAAVVVWILIGLRQVFDFNVAGVFLFLFLASGGDAIVWFGFVIWL